MLKSTRAIEGQIRERLRSDFASTLPRFDVMAALARSENGLKMSQISGLLRVSNGNVTGIVDRLADEGMLERVAVPGDRRASLVRLTTQGRAEFARQAEAHAIWIDTMLRGFSSDEARDLAARLELLEASVAPEKEVV